MTIFQTIAILLVLAAMASYINYRFVRLPETIGLMTISLLTSLLAVALGKFGVIRLQELALFISSIDFEAVLLHGMLAFLLFAGAMHVNLGDLRTASLPVGILSTLGVVMATVVTGSLFWWGIGWLGLEIPFIYGLLFGALISPTDPIAVLGIIKKVGAPKILETKIAGESLFNDGVGVVVFLTLVGFLGGESQPTFSSVSLLLLKEAVGGAVFGFAIGYAGYRLLRSVDAYPVEVLITLALASGGYVMAELLHISAPIAIVVAGLLIGNQGRSLAMSEKTRQHLDSFWELVDEILNAVLFVLIGLEIIVIALHWSYLSAGVVAIVVSLLGRYLSVGLPVALMKRRREFLPGTIRALTWGGLRGGISIALALSLPNGAERELIIATTYCVVVFSVLVQGLTFARLVERVVKV